ncbi:MAG: hypothetical protein ACP5G7_03050 [Anaerolineae bacterium]
MVDYPRKGLGLSVGGALLAVMVATLYALLHVAAGLPFGGQRVALHAMGLALFAGIIWIALRTIRLADLHYVIAQGYLYLDMGLCRWRVPLGSVDQIVQPKGISTAKWSWPGWTHGISRRGTDVVAYFASTLPQRRSLLLQGEGWSLLISPRDPTTFVQAFDRARRTNRSAGGITRSPMALAAWPVWRDRAMLYPIVLCLVSALLLYAGAARAYPSLSRQITVFGTGAAVRMLVPQDAARAIPMVAALVASFDLLVAMLLHRQSRVLARLLTYGVLVQQAILWVGLWQLVRA